MSGWTQKRASPYCYEKALLYNGGEAEIRTLGTVARTHALQACPLDQLGHLSNK
jgi:hypothetical protein